MLERGVARDGLFAHRFGEVPIQPVGEERRDGRDELRHRYKAVLQRFIRRALVGRHRALPEASAAEAHVPVRQLIHHEALNGAGCARGVVVVVGRGAFLDKGVHAAHDPAVKLSELLARHSVKLLYPPSVDVRVQCKKLIRIEQCAEEAALALVKVLEVELQVLPRGRVFDQVPAGGVGPIRV